MLYAIILYILKFMKFDLDKALDSNKTCVPLLLGIILKHFF